MKKLLLLVLPLVLVGCTKYSETGLLCEDAEHDSGTVHLSLDVRAFDKRAKIVVNDEKITLKSSGQQESQISYYGTNAAGEQVKLMIVLSDDGNPNYYLGINSGETTYGCYKK